MALTDQILDDLKKAIAKVQATSTSRQSWQEPFDHQTSVSPKSIQAAAALEGFAGSWAAQAALVQGASDDLQTTLVNKVEPQVVASHLGRPGVPESNFPLYAWGANKDKEAAFLGHPISFSIVGPTLRHKGVNWQWKYSTVGSDEILTLDTVAFDGGTPTASTIEEAYGISAMPSEGLYFVVSQTGSPAFLDVGGANLQGGVGDGLVNTGGGGTPITDKNGTGRYEIFRIADFRLAAMKLDPNKRFSDYFDVTAGTPILRALTLFKPFAARLVSVPSGGAYDANRVFLTVTPETTANGDLLPPYGTTATEGTWLGGNFADYDYGLKGTSSTYGGEAKLPVFTPKATGVARLQTTRYSGADGLPLEPGLLKLTNSTNTSVVVGEVISVNRVFQPNNNYGAPFLMYAEYQATGNGYYEVLDVSGGGAILTCKALPTVQSNGSIFYGPTALNAMIDYDGIPVSATGGVQIHTGGAFIAGVVVSVTIGNLGVTTIPAATYPFVTAGGEDAWDVANALAASINGHDPNVSVVLNPPAGPSFDVTMELTAKAAFPGVLGNAITLNVPSGFGSTYLSGNALGTTSGLTAGYSGTVTPVLGHGIGVDKFRLDVEFTVHDSVSNLFTGYFDPAKVQSNRLENLIDPSWNQQAASKLQSITQNPTALAAGRADKAVFDTTVGTKGAANPGSLLDLGFRMVLFPAKDDGTGNAVADFDNPITTQNVNLNPRITEAQFLYIDYASGAVVCSHTPLPGPRCTIAPNGIVGDGVGGNNPRGDIVLFASFVPYSRMPSQLGGGPQIQTLETVRKPVGTEYFDFRGGYQDVLGDRLMYQIAGSWAGLGLTLPSQVASSNVYLMRADETAPASTFGIPTITLNSPNDGDYLTFSVAYSAYQFVLTAKAFPVLQYDFQIGVSDADTAENLVTLINSDADMSKAVWAKADSAKVFIYTRNCGLTTFLGSQFPLSPLVYGVYQIDTSVGARLTLGGNPFSAFVPLFNFSQGNTIPQNGWFDVIEVGNFKPSLTVEDASKTFRRVATFSYAGKETVTDPAGGAVRTQLKNVFGGAIAGQDIDLSATEYYASFRKADVLPNDLSGNTGTSYQEDITEGFAARASTLRFAQGTARYSNGGLTLDLSGDFVQKRGDTMSGPLIITIDTVANPLNADSDGLSATGSGSKNGVVGNSGGIGGNGVKGVGQDAGVCGEGLVYGLQGLHTGTVGAGVYGEGNSQGRGVVGRGARGIVAQSNDSTTYPQAHLMPAGASASPPSDKQPGDLWVPNTGAAAGHLLVYNGSKYLDAYKSNLATKLRTAVEGGRDPSDPSFSETLAADTAATYLNGVGTAPGQRPMLARTFHHNDNASSTLTFLQVFEVTGLFSSLPATGSTALTVYHLTDFVEAVDTSKYQILVGRYRPSTNTYTAPVALSAAVAYTTNTLVTSDYTTAQIEATALGAAPFVAGDLVYVEIVFTTNHNGSNYQVFDMLFNYYEATYTSY